MYCFFFVILTIVINVEKNTKTVKFNGKQYDDSVHFSTIDLKVCLRSNMLDV